MILCEGCDRIIWTDAEAYGYDALCSTCLDEVRMDMEMLEAQTVIWGDEDLPCEEPF